MSVAMERRRTDIKAAMRRQARAAARRDRAKDEATRRRWDREFWLWEGALLAHSGSVEIGEAADLSADAPDAYDLESLDGLLDRFRSIIGDLPRRRRAPGAGR